MRIRQEEAERKEQENAARRAEAERQREHELHLAQVKAEQAKAELELAKLEQKSSRQSPLSPAQISTATPPAAVSANHTWNISSQSYAEKQIDINTASEAALASVPGVGVILAKKAISIRNQKGRFDSVDDFIVSVGVRSYQEEEARRVLMCQSADVSGAINSVTKGHGRKIEL